MAAAFRQEHAAIVDFYVARIEAAKRGASPAAIMAAIRALVNEKTVALRALADRRQQGRQSQRGARPVRAAGGMHPK